jgi:hypothetical protein
MDKTSQPDWNAEYEFFHKIILDEVDRLRFNNGFEPLSLELYETDHGYIGTGYLGRRTVRAFGWFCFDSAGKKMLKLSIRPQKLPEHLA